VTNASVIDKSIRLEAAQLLNRLGISNTDLFLDEISGWMVAEIIEHDPTFFHRINDTFFRRLERVGGIGLSPGMEGMIIAAIGMVGEPPSPKSIKEKYKARAALCLALKENLGDDFLLQGFISQLEFIHEASLRQIALSEITAGRREKSAPTYILRMMIHVFELAEGDLSLSRPDGNNYEGPFARFLSEVWGVVPQQHRPISPEEFVRKAVKLLRQSTRQEGGLLRSWHHEPGPPPQRRTNSKPPKSRDKNAV
jgi:hypothetical protein